MPEKLTPQNEKSPERGAEKAAELEALRKSPEAGEKATNLEREKNIEKAHDVLEQEQAERAKAERPSEKRETESGKIFSRREKKAAYKSEMKKVQQQLPPSARAFSKVVHNPVVEVVSDVAAETVLRPSFLIVGGISGLVFGGGLYIIAKIQGFILPNSQFVIAFLVGGAIGILGEFVVRLFKPKKR